MLETCDKCGAELQVGSWPFCRGGHAPVGSRNQDAVCVTVYRDASGHTIYPGRADAPLPARYAKLGYHKIEMNLAEARRFSSQMNRDERAKMAAHLEREQAHAEQLQSQTRAELRDAMRHMSPRGRDYVRAVMEQNNGRDTRAYLSSDPGFHNEALE